MLQRSAAFDQAVVAGARVVNRVTLSQGGVLLDQLPNVNFLPGAGVTLDEGAASRRAMSGSVADTGGLIPHLATDPLAPFGTDTFLEIGVELADGTFEYVPAGIYRLQSSKGASGQIALKGLDYSAVVAAAQNEKPMSFPAGTYVDDLIVAYVGSKLPYMSWTVTNPSVSHVPIPGPLVYQEGTSNGDPWKDCQTVAATVGCECYFDASGQLVIRPVPNPSTASIAWPYQPGGTNLAGPGESNMDITGIPNVIVVTSSGTNVNPPVQGSAEITDARSALYPGRIGRRPKFISVSNLTTNDQCTAAAQAELLHVTGLAADEGFPALPHPCHEPGDVVYYASNQTGANAVVALVSWTLPFDLLNLVTYKTRRTT